MIFLTNQGCAFFGESKNEFVISYHMDSSLTKKPRKIRKKDHYQDNGMSSCSCDDKNRAKKQQTNPRGEDKKEF